MRRSRMFFYSGCLAKTTAV